MLFNINVLIAWRICWLDWCGWFIWKHQTQQSFVKKKRSCDNSMFKMSVSIRRIEQVIHSSWPGCRNRLTGSGRTQPACSGNAFIFTQTKLFLVFYAIVRIIIAIFEHRMNSYQKFVCSYRLNESKTSPLESFYMLLKWSRNGGQWLFLLFPRSVLYRAHVYEIQLKPILSHSVMPIYFGSTSVYQSVNITSFAHVK